MKRICILLLVMILSALLLFGCKGNTPVSSEDSSLPESGASSAPEPVTPDETPVLRTLLRWGDITLCGYLQPALAGGFQTLSISGTEESENAGGTSLSFSLGKPDGEGLLSVNGFVYLGDDAGGLFDLDLEEDENDPAAQGKANDLLRETAEALAAEKGTKLQQQTSNGISWNYAFSETSGDGSVLLHLLAFAQLDKGLVYVSADACGSGGTGLEAVRETLQKCLDALTVSAEPEEKTQQIILPFGEHAFSAADWDLLSSSATELSWDSGEGWLSASCHTATQNGDIYGSLRSASAAQAEEISAARSLPAQSLGIWQYHLSENSLTAWTEVGEDTILFEYSADPAQEDGSVESELKRALEWLKTAAVS